MGRSHSRHCAFLYVMHKFLCISRDAHADVVSWHYANDCCWWHWNSVLTQCEWSTECHCLVICLNFNLVGHFQFGHVRGGCTFASKRVLISGCFDDIVLCLIYIDGDGLRYRLGFGFQTQWVHCTMQNMFTLHRLRLRSLLPISVQDSNLSPSPYPSLSPAM